MKSRMTNVTGGFVALFFLAAACAGTKLNDIGDINRNHAGSGGSGATHHVDPTGGADDTDDGAPQLGGGTKATGGTQATGVPMHTGGTKFDDGQVGLGGIVGRDPDPEPEVGGAGGAGAEEELVCADCQFVAQAPHIRAVASDSARVYWIEYGSFDRLDNYQADGRLLSLAFNETEPTVIAEGLGAPAELAITHDYAYVILEHSTSATGEVQLARIKLSGGTVQLLQAISNHGEGLAWDGARYDILDWFGHYFASGGGFVFWRNADTIYRLTENSNDPPVSFLNSTGAHTLLADGSKLYVQDEAGISAVSHTGTTLAPVFASADSHAVNPLVLSGDAFYGVGGYFTMFPKGGGTSNRLAAPPTGYVSRIVTNGTSYVGDFAEYEGATLAPALREGNLADPSSARILATISTPWHGRDGYLQGGIWRAWAATPTAVYLGYDGQLYRVARQF